MSTPVELALAAGIPVKQTRDGATQVRCTDATFEYLTSPHEPILLPPRCSCLQRPYPHELSVHPRAQYEKRGAYAVWDGKQERLIRFAGEELRWPWSLGKVGEA